MLSWGVESIALAAAQPWWPPVLAAFIPLVGVLLDEGQEAETCLTLGEFMTGYDSPLSPLASALAPVKKRFVGFNPESRPVLWRILIVHAHLYAVLSGHAENDGYLDFDSVCATSAEQEKLAWQNSAQIASDDPFTAARQYLAHQASWWSVAGGNGHNTLQLEELGQLHRRNVLTDDEYAAKKKAILGS